MIEKGGEVELGAEPMEIGPSWVEVVVLAVVEEVGVGAGCCSMASKPEVGV